MSRWLPPLVGVVGLLALVGGVVRTGLHRGSMVGVGVVGSGVVLLLVAGGLVAVAEVLARRRHPLTGR